MAMADVLKWIDFAKQVLPLALKATGKVPDNRIGPIVSAVGDAEIALGPGKGMDKLNAVLQGEKDVMTAAGASQATIDEVSSAVAGGLSEGITVVNAVNAIHKNPVSAPPAANELDGAGNAQASAPPTGATS